MLTVLMPEKIRFKNKHFLTFSKRKDDNRERREESTEQGAFYVSPTLHPGSFYIRCLQSMSFNDICLTFAMYRYSKAHLSMLASTFSGHPNFSVVLESFCTAYRPET